MTPRLSEHWLAGRLVAADEARPVAAGDQPGSPGCYTTARVSGGVARHAEAHASRLERDARALGIGAVSRAAVLELFSVLGRHAFGTGEGVIRVEACAASGDAAQLRGVPRALSQDGAAWTACIAPFAHGGPGPWPGAKLLDDPVYERARALATSEGVDEVLLLDGAGRLVEGSRSNLVAVDGAGRLCTPDSELGAVAGIALAAVREGFPELRIGEIRGAELHEMRELIAVNAVRGARAIAAVDGRPLGSGAPGTWSRRLDDFLSRA